MNWSAFTKKQQQMVIATGVLAVVQIVLMAHFLGWTKPASARGGSDKKELIELEKKLSNDRDILKSDQKICAELAESVGKLDALAVYAPTLSDRYAWAYEYLSRCAIQAKISLDSLEEVSGENKENPFYQIRVATRCDYNALVEFLSKLESGNPLLQVSEVTIASVDNMPQAHRVRVLIQWPSAVKVERGTP